MTVTGLSIQLKIQLKSYLKGQVFPKSISSSGHFKKSSLLTEIHSIRVPFVFLLQVLTNSHLISKQMNTEKIKSDKWIPSILLKEPLFILQVLIFLVPCNLIMYLQSIKDLWICTKYESAKKTRMGVILRARQTNGETDKLKTWRLQ